MLFLRPSLFSLTNLHQAEEAAPRLNTGLASRPTRAKLSRNKSPQFQKVHQSTIDRLPKKTEKLPPTPVATPSISAISRDGLRPLIGKFAQLNALEGDNFVEGSLELTKALTNQKELTLLKQGANVSVYRDANGAVYKIGNSRREEITRAIATSKTGIGPNVDINGSAWIPKYPGSNDGFLILKLEHIKGDLLSVRLEKLLQKKDTAELKKLLVSVVDLLARYHSLGWAHGDFHSKNIIFRNAKSKPLIIDNGETGQIARIRKAQGTVHQLVSDYAHIVRLIKTMFPSQNRAQYRQLAAFLLDSYTKRITRQVKETSNAMRAQPIHIESTLIKLLQQQFKMNVCFE
jgi:tRNA A-37 threonylcarbamoyl transferase component Bud32